MFGRRRVRVASRRPGRSLFAFAIVTASIVAVTMGPKPVFVDRWTEPTVPEDVDAWLAAREGEVDGLEASRAKEIVWAGEPGERTRFSVVYLHGFSADKHEMAPVAQRVAAGLGANLFLARLAGHALGPEALGAATVGDWLDDTAEAIAVGGAIGDRVIVVGTSTGGTLATWLATKQEAADRLAAIVLVSPNFHPKNRMSRIPLYPWGERIGSLVAGGDRCWEPSNEEQARHWTTCYPMSSIVEMMTLVEHVRLADLSGITVPVLVLYSPEDQVVEPGETLRVVPGMTGTDPVVTIVDGVTDRSRHVLAGDILSPGTNEQVVALISDFLSARLADVGGRP
ncbi:MAG: alpha/beta fold hydrolase [Gemmatimonadota bacterium]